MPQPSSLVAEARTRLPNDTYDVERSTGTNHHNCHVWPVNITSFFIILTRSDTKAMLFPISRAQLATYPLSFQCSPRAWCRGPSSWRLWSSTCWPHVFLRHSAVLLYFVPSRQESIIFPQRLVKVSAMASAVMPVLLLQFGWFLWSGERCILWQASHC